MFKDAVFVDMIHVGSYDLISVLDLLGIEARSVRTLAKSALELPIQYYLHTKLVRSIFHK